MERSYVVGSVPYVNARPLVDALESEPERFPVRVQYDVPSQLPAMLDRGEADAVLASSIECLSVPGRRIAAALCIASRGPVHSVRLFSKVPPSRIRILGLDSSSLTSNALAQIILAERFGAKPVVRYAAPDLTEMLRDNDACVLIGDIGMRADGDGLHVLDLGGEWTELTGLPFVWALWIGRENLTEELAGHLLAARLDSQLGAGRPILLDSRGEEQIRKISQSSSWTYEEVRDYLLETIVFDLGASEMAGLRKFQEKLRNHGFSADHFPDLIEPKVALAQPKATAK